MWHRLNRFGFVTAVPALVALALGAAWSAPYLYAECALRRHDELVGPQPQQPLRGRWFDDYFVIEEIDPATFAIGEPRYYQGNYSYLILGTARAVLVDGGTGNRDIVPVVRSLTALPVTVVPSHLHFDHVGALGRFDRTALLDAGDLRARVRGGLLELRRYEFLGFADGLRPPRFRVDDWWRPATTLDLGGRRLTVIDTPGHTPTSVSLYDAERHQLFCGDFIYPGLLYAFLPGASRSAYQRTAQRLLAELDPGTELLTAHLADEPALIAAPRLGMADLRALLATLEAIDAGAGTPTGFYPRTYPVNATLRFASGFAWTVR
jgi:glyoxylase-like metal-dependent hydrolase (beta-lactamase superfamily II)